MLCPYCLNQTNDPQCKNCHETLPPYYIQQHGPFSRKPAILSAVGFSGHGKTVYLATLLYILMQRLPQHWSKFCCMGMDKDTVKNVSTNINLLLKGDLPESTRRNFPRPSVHLLSDIPNFGNRTMLIYDPPGEVFKDPSEIERYAHFIKKAKAVVFLVSLADLGDSKASEMHELLNFYVLGMANMGARTQDQHLIVTYTKSDLLVSSLQNRPNIVEHLSNPDNSSMANPKKYQNTLNNISLELANFTAHELEASSFINLARKSFRTTVYSAVSALGSAPENGHLTTVIEPRRVMDPLFWVLEKS